MKFRLKSILFASLMLFGAFPFSPRGAEPSAETYTVAKIKDKAGIRSDQRPIPIGFFAPEVKKTFIAIMGEESNCYVMALDHATGQWSDAKLVGKSTTPDKHNYPGVLRGADGRIYVFYGCHNSPLRMTVSPEPLSIDGQWRDVSIPEADHASYPAPIITANGDLYVFYRNTRETNNYADDRPYMYVKSTDSGKTWSAHFAIDPFPRKDNFTEIYNGLVTLEPARNGNPERIHLAWTFCGGGIGKHAHATYGQSAYYAWFDPATAHFHSVDGTDLGEKIDAEKAESKCLVFDGGYPRNGGHLAGLEVSVLVRDNGMPLVHFDRENAGGLSSAMWDGAKWVISAITGRNGEPRGFEKIGPDSFRVYNPARNGVNIYRTDTGGTSWTLESTIATPAPIDRALLISNYNPDAKLLLTSTGSQNIHQPSRDLFIAGIASTAGPGKKTD